MEPLQTRPLEAISPPTYSATHLSSSPGPLGSHGSVDRLSGDHQGLLLDAPRQVVKRLLLPIHIIMIVISGTVGMGLFENSGRALNIAGPAGGIVAFAFVGFGVTCVMEGFAEMIGHWPTANAMVEFVKAFVDRDLAIVVGIAYWFSYAINFGTMILAAVNLATYWDLALIFKTIIFMVGAPILLLAINGLGIFWFANFEVVLGILKITFVVGTFLAMCIINNKDTNADTPNGKIQATFLNQGFQNNPTIASSRLVAILVAIPIITYAYMGVEIVAVTALEAKSPRLIKHTARLIAWIISGVYFVVGIGLYLNVSWTDPLLPSVPSSVARTSPTVASSTSATRTSAIAVIALLNAHMPKLAGLVNGCLIMAVLGAANTDLYVASRTLFGLTRDVDPTNKYWGLLSKLGTTTHDRKVPAAALLFSASAFYWVPFLQLNKSADAENLQQIMTGMTTSSVVLVWGSQCLAFIRYHRWIAKFRNTSHLVEEYPQFNRWYPTNSRVPTSTFLGWMQPLPAYIGLTFCTLSALVFFTATAWNGNKELVTTYSASITPLLFIILWLFFKLLRFGNFNFEWYVKLGNWEELRMRIDSLAAAVVDDQLSIPLNTLASLTQASREDRLLYFPNEERGLNSGDARYDDVTNDQRTLSPVGMGEDQLRAQRGDSRRLNVRNPSSTSGISSSISMPGQGTEASKPIPRTSASVADNPPSSIVPEAGPSSGTLGQQAIQVLQAPITALQSTVPPTTTLALTREQIIAGVVVGGFTSAAAAVNIGTNIATVRQTERKLAIEEQVERDRVADRKKKEEEEQRSKQKDNELDRGSGAPPETQDRPGRAEGFGGDATVTDATSTSKAAIQTSPGQSTTISSRRSPAEFPQPTGRLPYPGLNNSGSSRTGAIAAKSKEKQQAQLEKLNNSIEQQRRKRIKEIEEKVKNVERFKNAQAQSSFPRDESTLHNERLYLLREKHGGPQSPKGGKATEESSGVSSEEGKGKGPATLVEDFETVSFSDDEDISQPNLPHGENISLGKLPPVDHVQANGAQDIEVSPINEEIEGSPSINPGVLDETEDENSISNVEKGASKDNTDS